MSNFDTLPESVTNTTSDLFIMRQGSIDVKVKREVVLDLLFPVGATWMTVDSLVTPTMQGFAGTWELLPTDCVLVTSAITDVDIGVVKGDNEVTTPLTQHTHSGSTSTDADHTHLINNGLVTYDRLFNTLDNLQQHSTPPVTSPLQANGDHSHTATLSTEGVLAPMLDVAGERYNLNVWKRTL